MITNFILSDNVPTNLSALLTSYDANEPSALTGFGVKLVQSGISYLSSASDTDLGSLTTTGGTFGKGMFNISLNTLAIGANGQACFQGTIR